jgi:hypothetical protein
MTGTEPITSDAAHEAFVDHPYFAYRGCAPDPDDPRRAAGNPALSLDAWHGEDRDGAEPQGERRARVAAAVDVCMGCAVWAQCDAYANSLTPEGRLAEPEGIRAGRTALERHRALIAVRQVAAPVPAPVEQIRTEQKLAVLRALAVHADPVRVAAAAGVDVRTAQWQRSRLVTQLGLPRSASRRDLLAAAVARGLLRSDEVVADPGGPVRPVQLSLFPQASRLGVAA